MKKLLSRFRTIHSKQLLLAVLVSALPLMIIGQFLNDFFTERLRNDVKVNLRQISNDKALSIEQWVSERFADTIMLASTEACAGVLKNPSDKVSLDRFKKFYKTFAEQYRAYTFVQIFDARNKELLVYPHIYEPLPGLPQINIPKSSETTMSDAFLFEGKAHMLLSALVEENETTLGRVIIGVDLETLNQITDNIILGESGEAYIVNSRGYFITHQHRKKVLRENYSDVEIIVSLMTGNEQSFVREVNDYRGVPVLGAYYYFSNYNWGLVTEQDYSEAFKPVHQVNQSMLLWLALSSLFASVVAYHLTKRNLRPLNQFKATIEKVGKGDLGIRYPVTKDDEIGIIGRVFNKMLDDLETTQSKLQSKVQAADRKLLLAHEALKKRHAELKHAQERLLHSERLSTMGEVAAGLAHEINNPLSTISMLISSLNSEWDIEAAERDQVLSVIQEEIEKIASMIGRFQDLTHPPEMRTEPVVIERVIDRTLQLCGPKLNNARIEVATSIDRNIPTIIGDERHLRQLLLNIVLNAIHAMPDGGDISISAESHKEDDKRYLRIKVKDSGYGMSEETIDRAFKPFFTTRAEGTGLGLLIVAQTAERHGGKVMINSEKNQGTEIVIDLPEKMVS